MVAPTEVERTLRTIFKRCVICPTEVPSCPSCPGNEICSLVPQSCNSCAYNTCIANPSPGPVSSGPNVGAIAGGVIGGVLFIVVAVLLLWKFWIKKRREQQEYEAEIWGDDDIAQQKAGGGLHHMRHDAASTRTRASFANSILSRASNIIQIAYIPGVTNRNGSSHNSLAPVPPVPAIYANSTPRSPLSNDGDALFFRPESTWSESTTRSGNRDTQYTRRSITPSLARSSIASTIYGDDASAPPMPAMPVARAIPRIVSVKNTQQNTSGGQTVAGGSSGSPKVIVPGQPSSPNPSNSPRTAGSFGRATKVTVGGKGRFPVRQADADSQHTPTTSSPLAAAPDDETEDEDERTAARRSLLGSPLSNTANISSPALNSPALSNKSTDSPFFDASELLEEPALSPAPASATATATATATSPSASSPRANPYAAMSSAVGSRQDEKRQTRGPKSVSGLSAVMEESSRHTSTASVRLEDHHSVKSGESPFSDEHATG